jgi:hypothetical protein
MPYKDPEVGRARKKAYYEANKQNITEYMKTWLQTPAGKKSQTIKNWKRSGLLYNNMDNLYDTYLQSTHCDACKFEYKDSYDRCMDHDHETGLFRQFLCRGCNTKDSWKKINTPSSS